VLVGAWAFNYLFVRAGLGFAAPLWLAFGRAAVGALGVAVLLGVRPALRGHLDGRGRRDAALLGIPTTALFFGLWFTAAGSVLPGEAAVVVYTFPLWVALFSGPVLGYRLPAVAFVAIASGFAGIVLVSEPWAGGGALPPVAVFELLGGAISWAAGTVAYQRRFHGSELEEGNLYQLAGGSLGLAVAAVATASPLPSPSWTLLAIVVWLGFVGTAVGYAIWFRLLTRLPAATLSVYIFLVPVVALVASAVIFAERIDAVQVAGVGAVVVSIYLTGRSGRPR